MLRQCLVVLDKHEWKAEALENFGSVLLNTLFKQNHAIGLLMHFIDVYIEEVAKVTLNYIFYCFVYFTTYDVFINTENIFNRMNHFTH